MQTIKQQRLKQGMKGQELAKRMQVSAARISVLERDEARGAVTLNMLHKAAKALHCRLEYSLIPVTEVVVTPSENQNSRLGQHKLRVKLHIDGSGTGGYTHD